RADLFDIERRYRSRIDGCADSFWRSAPGQLSSLFCIRIALCPFRNWHRNSGRDLCAVAAASAIDELLHQSAAGSFIGSNNTDRRYATVATAIDAAKSDPPFRNHRSRRHAQGHGTRSALSESAGTCRFLLLDGWDQRLALSPAIAVTRSRDDLQARGPSSL